MRPIVQILDLHILKKEPLTVDNNVAFYHF